MLDYVVRVEEQGIVSVVAAMAVAAVGDDADSTRPGGRGIHGFLAGAIADKVVCETQSAVAVRYNAGRRDGIHVRGESGSVTAAMAATGEVVEADSVSPGKCQTRRLSTAKSAGEVVAELDFVAVVQPLVQTAGRERLLTARHILSNQRAMLIRKLPAGQRG
jgi:hypothetical protein